MVLASQTPRSTNRWRYMTNENRRRSRFWPILIVLIGGGSLVTWLIFGNRGEQGGTAPEPSNDLSNVSNGESPAGSISTETPGTPSDSIAWRRTPREESRRLGDGAGEPARGASGGTASDSLTLGGAKRTNEKESVPPSPPARPDPTLDPPIINPGPPSNAVGSAPEQNPASPQASPEPIREATKLAQRDPVAARRQLTALAGDARLSPAERAAAREAAASINRAILFGPAFAAGDAFARKYVVQEKDTLEAISKREGLDADWRFLKRVNGIVDERKLRIGQTIKVVPGAFHAVISKSDFRMDIYLGEGPQRVLAASFPVGLGEYNSTPTGRFKVRPRSKLVEPAWTNPRTGEHYRSDDPKNPIGDRWIGIQGLDATNSGVEGYGIHGTVDPASIGKQASMGCVRLHAVDVALLYELLTEPNSTIVIGE